MVISLTRNRCSSQCFHGTKRIIQVRLEGRVMKRFITFIAVMLLATLVHAFGEYTIPVPASYDVLAGEHTLVDLVQVDGNTVLRFTNAGGTWVGTSENGEQF